MESFWDIFPHRSLGFRQKSGFKTTPRRRNIFLENLFLRLGLGFCRKTGIKTKPRQRNKSPATFIYPPEFMFLPKRRF